MQISTPPSHPSPQASSPIPYSRQTIDEADIAAVSLALQSDFLTQGPTIQQFEDALANYLGVQYVVVTSSATAALHICMAALNQGPNSLGITSPISFAASANCLLYVNSNVNFCDVNPHNGLLDPHCLQDLLPKLASKSHSPGVIIPVSLQGQCPDLPQIHQLAKKFNWYVVEDAAQSLGATYSHNNSSFKSASCSHSDAAILSFHPLKHITTGEGGAITTNNKQLADKAKLLRSHGIIKGGSPSWFYDQLDLGWNYRLTDFQAALGLSQLKKLPSFLHARRNIAAYYNQKLSTPPFAHHIHPTLQSPGHSYHLYVIHFKNASIRNQAHEFLHHHNILSQVHHRPIYQFPVYQQKYGKQYLPAAEFYSQSALSIPIFPSLSSQQCDYILDSLLNFTLTL